jgi:hypothetical protein
LYTDRELSRLAALKSVLQTRITKRRATCADAAAKVLRPLARLDKFVTLFVRAMPYVPLLVPSFIGRSKPPQAGLRRSLATALVWGPLILSVWRGIYGSRRR